MGQCDLGGNMNDKIKNFINTHYIFVLICIILCIIACIWFYADRASNIDTTGIQRATTEVDNARQYNRRAVEDNRRARTAIEHSQDVNDRIERTITRIDESNKRTEDAYLEMQTRELQKIKMQQRNSKLLNILLGGAVVYLAAKN